MDFFSQLFQKLDYYFVPEEQLIILSLTFIIGCFIIWLLVRYILDIGPNWFFVTEYGVLVATFATYISYFEYHIHTRVGLVISALVLLPGAIFATVLVSKRVKRKRCSNCHIFVRPIKLDRKEGSFYLDNYSDTGKKIMVDKASNRSVRGSDIVAERFYYYNFETEGKLGQNMQYRNCCPMCLHEWESNEMESCGTIRGPIRFVKYTDTTFYWQEEETEYEVVKFQGQEISREQIGSRTINHSQEADRVQNYKYDIDRYKPYYERYVNGDRNALNEYYEKYWGKVFFPL